MRQGSNLSRVFNAQDALDVIINLNYRVIGILINTGLNSVSMNMLIY